MDKTKLNDSHNQEIDLLKLLHILWAGKWIIISLTFISVTFGSLIILSSEEKYQSTITISLIAVPPSLSSPKSIMTDFKYKLLSEEKFTNWLKDNKEAIQKKSRSNNHSITSNNITFKKESIKFKIKPDDTGSILVASNDKLYLNYIYIYTTYMANRIRSEYVDSTYYEIKWLEDTYNSKENDVFAKEIIKSKRFLKQIQLPTGMFYINSPTPPKKISPNNKFILIASTLFGMSLGIFYLIIGNARTRGTKYSI